MNLDGITPGARLVGGLVLGVIVLGLFLMIVLAARAELRKRRERGTGDGSGPCAGETTACEEAGIEGSEA